MLIQIPDMIATHSIGHIHTSSQVLKNAIHSLISLQRGSDAILICCSLLTNLRVDLYLSCEQTENLDPTHFYLTRLIRLQITGCLAFTDCSPCSGTFTQTMFFFMSSDAAACSLRSFILIQVLCSAILKVSLH